MGVAVQVFYNLGTLADTLLATVKGCSNNIQQQTQDALNPATLTEGKCIDSMDTFYFVIKVRGTV